jgi:ubiquinone/menaquinone biosynthesis C-methylase UbiE
MDVGGWIALGAVLIGIAIFAYWQLVVAEGAYLGTRVVALLYDWFAPRYDQVKQYDKATDAIMLASPILRHLARSPHPLSQGERGVVLDVATGTGRLPDALLSQPRFKGRVVALDASGRMLALAQHKLAAPAAAGRITFLERDAQRLPFDDETFDVVTCLEALEFMRDWRAAVCEMLRVLRPGGLLMISNRIGPDAWKLPGRAVPTDEFTAWLSQIGLQHIETHTWLIDYDLVTGIKEKSSC